MTSITHSPIGIIHLISSCLALSFGTYVLLTKKGTQTHKKMGYAYTVSMLILNLTAFGIYRLFGGFGPFHITAIISLLTLLSGMIPVIIRKPENNWLGFHAAFMYYSVIGLYAAFVSEIVTRIPGINFGVMVGVGTALVMGLGVYFFQKNKSKWSSLR